MKKKLFSLALCVIMVVAMAAPAFAVTRADPPYGPYGNYVIYNRAKNAAGQWQMLNVYANSVSQVSNGTDVTVYSPTGSQTQRWKFESLANGLYAVHMHFNENYVLNINTNTRNCNVWLKSGLVPNDYSIRLADDGGIVIMHYLLALTPTGTSKPAGGHEVVWADANGQMNQLWTLDLFSD